MADRKIIVDGRVYLATTERKVIVGDRVFLETVPAAVGGRIMSSMAGSGGLAGMGGIAGPGGGLAG